MLETTPSPERVALNRATYGASEADLLAVQTDGWSAWVTNQLSPPSGDDPELAAYLATQTMPISYRADPDGAWPDVDEDRPLNYLNQSVEEAWDLLIGAVTDQVSFAELYRMQQEFHAAHWIRASHSQYQLREVMVDFWHNHFNIGGGDTALNVTLMSYDREAIRPHALGNFTEMLEANASSSAMLLYLDNWVSQADHPNENYARELLELHTMGEDAYFGQGSVPTHPNGTQYGFNDDDVFEVSKALSGWTIEGGQWQPGGRLPRTGKFIFSEFQHNTEAKTFLNKQIGQYEGIEQGQKVLELAAQHSMTAEFITGKMLNRFFNGIPSEDLHQQMIDMWMANLTGPDQIAKTVEVMLLSPEFMERPAEKVRRPFEKMMAYARTASVLIGAHQWTLGLITDASDGIYTWPAPNGRPDVNGYWLSSNANRITWNLSLAVPVLPTLWASTGYEQMPETTSAFEILDFWIDRMVGYAISDDAYNALLTDITNPGGLIDVLASGGTGDKAWATDRLTALISTTDEFAYR